MNVIGLRLLSFLADLNFFSFLQGDNQVYLQLQIVSSRVLFTQCSLKNPEVIRMALSRAHSSARAQLSP